MKSDIEVRPTHCMLYLKCPVETGQVFNSNHDVVHRFQGLAEAIAHLLTSLENAQVVSPTE